MYSEATCLFHLMYFTLKLFILVVGVWPVNTVILSGGVNKWTQSSPVHVSILPQAPLPSRLPQKRAQQSSWYRCIELISLSEGILFVTCIIVYPHLLRYHVVVFFFIFPLYLKTISIVEAFCMAT